jgi:hypothetical protein
MGVENATFTLAGKLHGRIAMDHFPFFQSIEPVKFSHCENNFFSLLTLTNNMVLLS